MKKIKAALIIVGMFTSFTAMAANYVFNNSESYSMRIEYRPCFGDPANYKCKATEAVTIPNAKAGKNYIQIDASYIVVTKVSEEDVNGNTRLSLDSLPSYNACSTFSHGNSITLDDMHESDKITCAIAFLRIIEQ